MFDNVLNTPLSPLLLINLYSDLILRIFKIMAYSEISLFRYMQAYSKIFSIIKAYSQILRHYYGLFRIIPACSQTCHIPSLDIFKTTGILKKL